MAQMHFIFAEKYFDNRDNRPQNTCVTSDKLSFYFLSLEVKLCNIFICWKVLLFFCYKNETFGRQSVPSQPTQPER